MKKRNKKYHPKKIDASRFMRSIRLLAEAEDFEEIDRFIRLLKLDEVTETKDETDGKWKLTQINRHGEVYDLLGTATIWCDFYAKLAPLYMPSYNDTPLRKVITKLRLEQELTLEMIEAAEQVVYVQRLIFRVADSNVFNQYRAELHQLLDEREASYE